MGCTDVALHIGSKEKSGAVGMFVLVQVSNGAYGTNCLFQHGVRIVRLRHLVA
jgi:hypothetical protein